MVGVVTGRSLFLYLQVWRSTHVSNRDTKEPIGWGDLWCAKNGGRPHLIGDEFRDLGTADGRRSRAENGVGLDKGGYS